VVIKGAAEAPGQSGSIMRALNRAARGAKITIKPETYEEVVVVTQPGVTLQAAGTRGQVIVKAPAGRSALTISADGVTVRTLTLKSTAEAGNKEIPTVRITQGAPSFKDCEVVWEGADNATPEKTGPCVEANGAAAQPTFEGCTFDYGHRGIFATASARVTLRDCTITYSHTGVFADKSSRAELSRCAVKHIVRFALQTRSGGKIDAGACEQREFTDNNHNTDPYDSPDVDDITTPGMKSGG
jgi:hypothetical protein